MTGAAAVAEQIVAVATISTPAGAVAAVARQQIAVATVVAAQGPAGPPGQQGPPGGSFVVAIVTAEPLAIGQPLAIRRSDGKLCLARADMYTKAFVVGLASAVTAPGFAASPDDVALTLDDWTAVTGSPSLVPGCPYFLGVSGGLVLVPDRTPGNSVARVGAAASPTTLIIAPSPPILL